LYDRELIQDYLHLFLTGKLIKIYEKIPYKKWIFHGLCSYNKTYESTLGYGEFYDWCLSLVVVSNAALVELNVGIL
jgi:hypothetical protein